MLQWTFYVHMFAFAEQYPQDVILEIGILNKSKDILLF